MRTVTTYMPPLCYNAKLFCTWVVLLSERTNLTAVSALLCNILIYNSLIPLDICGSSRRTALSVRLNTFPYEDPPSGRQDLPSVAVHGTLGVCEVSLSLNGVPYHTF